MHTCIQVGLPFERNCNHCHSRLALRVAAVSFVPRRPHQAGGAKRGPGLRTGKQAGGQHRLATGALALGQPLPAFGTCKHYRHSHRWLRFPCCGMRFPCDLCHEEEVADGHPVRWAQRMVCGFCSCEQAVAPDCKLCARKVRKTFGVCSLLFTDYLQK